MEQRRKKIKNSRKIRVPKIRKVNLIIKNKKRKNKINNWKKFRIWKGSKVIKMEIIIIMIRNKILKSLLLKIIS